MKFWAMAAVVNCVLWMIAFHVPARSRRNMTMPQTRDPKPGDSAAGVEQASFCRAVDPIVDSGVGGAALDEIALNPPLVVLQAKEDRDPPGPMSVVRCVADVAQ